MVEKMKEAIKSVMKDGTNSASQNRFGLGCLEALVRYGRNWCMGFWARRSARAASQRTMVNEPIHMNQNSITAPSPAKRSKKYVEKYNKDSIKITQLSNMAEINSDTLTTLGKITIVL